jgi:malate dehydrogenase
MVPLIGQTIVGGRPIAELVPAGRLEEIVQRARDGGAEIVNYLKTGSAYYAPSASVVQMVESILFDKNEVLPCTAYLQGEYGASGVYAGVPVVLGQKGVERIVEFKLTEKEKTQFQTSVDSVRELISIMESS